MKTISSYLSILLLLGVWAVMPSDLNAQEYSPRSLHNGPAWAPNGYSIAFAASYSGNFNVYTIDIWSLERRQITRHSANDMYPAWSPNGRLIAFYSDRVNETGPFPPDSVVYKVKDLYETYARDGYRPSWSPQGVTIAAHFRSERGNYEIYLMNSAGKDRRPITDNMATDVHPKFSPDGEKIVFLSDRDYDPEIYVMNKDGSEQTRLTESEAYDVDPVWSPDSKKIAYSSNMFGSFDIFVMNADGTDKRLLTESPSIDIAPTWSPDGKKILFSSNRSGYFNLYIVDVESGNVERLTDSDFHEYHGSWSPNGSRIAYLSTKMGEPHLYLMNSDGTRKRQLTVYR
jgi:Tol biopolymer transport system component